LRNRVLRNLTHTLVATSRERQYALAKSFGCAASEIKLIHNAIDTSRFSPLLPDEKAQSHAEDKLFNLISVASLTEIKNLSCVFEAIAVLSKKGYQIHLTVCGTGPEYANLTHLTQELAIAKNITMTGHHEAVHQILHTFDLFVLVPKMEAFGLVFVEAMAAGLPVVASRVGGIPDIVTDKQTGLLIDDIEPTVLAEAIEWFITDRDRMREAGMKGKIRAESLFDIKRMINEYENTYKALLPTNIDNLR